MKVSFGHASARVALCFFLLLGMLTACIAQDYQKGMDYTAYPPLKQVYSDYFELGIFGSGEPKALAHNFASFAPGNEMKPENTQRVKGNFTYSLSDNKFREIVSAAPGIKLYGHTLAWHSQSPTWMWDAAPARHGQPGNFDRATSLQNLRTHVRNVLGYYGSRLEGVDVVNEAVGRAVPGDWRASLAKGEGWYNALGADWVEEAFLEAARVVDQSPGWRVKLIYNDFGLDNPDKARAVYEMVKELNETWAGSRPGGKQLIEVIGMQGHYNLSTRAEDVENSIRLFSTLPGVRIHITELDVGVPAPGVLTPDLENDQAMKYAELFSVYKRYAVGPSNQSSNPKVVERVAISGVRDAAVGWRAGEFALLFDYDGRAKESLVAVISPEHYLSTHDYSVREIQVQEVAQVAGIHVWDTANGDSWSGANIILGQNPSVWPWSSAGEDGQMAFNPQADATYRITLNYSARGTNAIRVRWVKDNSNGAYTRADGAVVNDFQYGPDEVTTTIPAYFNRGMQNGQSYTLVLEHRLDSSQAADGLIGNIAVRGGLGGNAFSINWIKIELLGPGGSVEQQSYWSAAP